ncbi:hypothetical protein STEG23_008705 [Scotinomys teguina]
MALEDTGRLYDMGIGKVLIIPDEFILYGNPGDCATQNRKITDTEDFRDFGGIGSLFQDLFIIAEQQWMDPRRSRNSCATTMYVKKSGKKDTYKLFSFKKKERKEGRKEGRKEKKRKEKKSLPIAQMLPFPGIIMTCQCLAECDQLCAWAASSLNSTIPPPMALDSKAKCRMNLILAFKDTLFFCLQKVMQRQSMRKSADLLLELAVKSDSRQAMSSEFLMGCTECYSHPIIILNFSTNRN